MRRFLVLAALLATAVAGAPAPARAGAVLEGSLGVGMQLDPTVDRTPLNVMLAPGFTFTDYLRLQLGLVANLADVQNSKFDLELRPMVTLAPPVLPLYGRAIVAVQNLVNGPTTWALGGALGVSFGLAGASVFVEAGVLPHDVRTATGDDFRWFAEARAGVGFVF